VKYKTNIPSHFRCVLLRTLYPTSHIMSVISARSSATERADRFQAQLWSCFDDHVLTAEAHLFMTNHRYYRVKDTLRTLDDYLVDTKIPRSDKHNSAFNYLSRASDLTCSSEDNLRNARKAYDTRVCPNRLGCDVRTLTSVSAHSGEVTPWLCVKKALEDLNSADLFIGEVEECLIEEI
jgi:hypothetical protein